MAVKTKDRISASQILYVLAGGPPPQTNPELARQGIRAHKDIAARDDAGDIPPGLIRAGLSAPVETEKKFARKIADELLLTARADMVAPGKIADVKPGKQLRGRHLLQVALTCVASEETVVDGAVFQYQNGGKTYLIEGGGLEVTGEIEVLAKNSRQILDITEHLRNNTKINGAARDAMGEKACRLKVEMDEKLRVVMANLQGHLRVI